MPGHNKDNAHLVRTLESEERTFLDEFIKRANKPNHDDIGKRLDALEKKIDSIMETKIANSFIYIPNKHEINTVLMQNTQYKNENR